MKEYTIKTGKRIIAIAMAQNNFGGSWAQVFLDCTRCDQSIGLRFDSAEAANEFSDTQATKVFHERGWTISPTLCPDCIAAQDTATL